MSTNLFLTLITGVRPRRDSGAAGHFGPVPLGAAPAILQLHDALPRLRPGPEKRPLRPTAAGSVCALLQVRDLLGDLLHLSFISWTAILSYLTLMVIVAELLIVLQRVSLGLLLAIASLKTCSCSRL